jgi:hypothetical protein
MDVIIKVDNLKTDKEMTFILEASFSVYITDVYNDKKFSKSFISRYRYEGGDKLFVKDINNLTDVSMLSSLIKSIDTRIERLKGLIVDEQKNYDNSLSINLLSTDQNSKKDITFSIADFTETI